MPKYKVLVTEHIGRNFILEAGSKEEAEQLVEEFVWSGESPDVEIKLFDAFTTTVQVEDTEEVD